MVMCGFVYVREFSLVSLLCEPEYMLSQAKLPQPKFQFSFP